MGLPTEIIGHISCVYDCDRFCTRQTTVLYRDNGGERGPQAMESHSDEAGVELPTQPQDGFMCCNGTFIDEHEREYQKHLAALIDSSQFILVVAIMAFMGLFFRLFELHSEGSEGWTRWAAAGVDLCTTVVACLVWSRKLPQCFRGPRCVQMTLLANFTAIIIIAPWLIDETVREMPDRGLAVGSLDHSLPYSWYTYL